jgi:phospholipid/cholesterol/gamma-HCH transport system substrate-binding protein
MATTELKVGVFTLVAVAIVVGGYVWSYDGIRAEEAAIRLDVVVPSADGLFSGSSVRIAGVEVGSIDEIGVEGDRARLGLRVRPQYQLPIDTVAEVRSSGLLGDRYIALIPGSEPALLQDGGRLDLGRTPGDIDVITRQVEDISGDVKAITSALRLVAENEANRQHVEGTLANTDALMLELRMIAEQNHQDVNAIVDATRRLTTNLEALSVSLQRDVDLEMAKLHDVTDGVNRSVEDIESITGKIDRGEGTIGALVNDATTIETLNETISNVNSVVEGFTRTHAEVYYTGRWYFGSQPTDTDTFFYGNPLAGSGSNTIGMLLQPQEDFWYVFEVNDYPLGTVTYAEHYFPDTGQIYTEYVREPNYRFTFQMAKRWWDLELRLGVKENGGGVGATLWLFEDRVQLAGDVFDFDLSSYPATKTPYPNVRLFARYEPIDHVYFDLGSEQLLLGLRYGYQTGFAGVGFHFNDDDLRWLLATLPLPF